jgi:hypothetical protein
VQTGRKSGAVNRKKAFQLARNVKKLKPLAASTRVWQICQKLNTLTCENKLPISPGSPSDGRQREDYSQEGSPISG